MGFHVDACEVPTRPAASPRPPGTVAESCAAERPLLQPLPMLPPEPFDLVRTGAGTTTAHARASFLVTRPWGGGKPNSS